MLSTLHNWSVMFAQINSSVPSACFTFVNLFVVEGELSSPDSTTIKLSTANISSNFGLSILIVTEYEPIIHDMSCLILQGNFAPLFKAPDEQLFSEIT